MSDDAKILDEAMLDEVEQTIEVVEFDGVDNDIAGTLYAFPALGADNPGLNHQLLEGRYAEKQHSIEAIEGLRQELDKIESLQVVYSDKTRQADYYMWDDGNEHGWSRYGLFVSIVPDTDHIQMCDGTTDVFGVTVSEAGFVGGQEYTYADDKYDRTYQSGKQNKREYCLVVHSGLVGVRHTTDVNAGDYVVPNWRGEAQKSDGHYGYLVSSLRNINGISYAMISLSASSTLAQREAEIVADLNERMTGAEIRIGSVSDKADDAYNMAQEALDKAVGGLGDFGGQIEGVLGTIENMSGTVGSLEIGVQNALNMASQAQATIGSINSEVVDKISMVQNDVSEMQKTADDLKTQVEGTAGDMQSKYEDLKKTVDDNASVLAGSELYVAWDVTQPNLIKPSMRQGSIEKRDGLSIAVIAANIIMVNGTATANTEIKFGQVEVNNTDYSSYILTGCPSSDDKNGYSIEANFADNRSEYDTGDGCIFYAQNLNGVRITINISAGTECNHLKFRPCLQKYIALGTGLVGLANQVDQSKAELSALAGYEFYDEYGNVIANGLSGLMSQVTKDGAALDAVAEFTHIDEETGKESTGLAGLMAQVNADGAVLNDVAEFSGPDGTTGLAGMMAQVTADSSTLDNIVNLKQTDADGNVLFEGVAGIAQQVSNNMASINSVVQHQNEQDMSMASIKAQADANGASIQSIVMHTPTYTVGPYSPTYALSSDRQNKAMQDGMCYVTTTSHTEKLGNTNITFTKSYLYTWSNANGGQWVVSSKPCVQYFRCEVDPELLPDGNTYQFFVVEDYDFSYDGAIYKIGDLYLYNTDTNLWEQVASTRDIHYTNLSSITQTQDSITAQVSTIEGNFSALEVKVDENKASASLLTEMLSKKYGQVHEIQKTLNTEFKPRKAYDASGNEVDYTKLPSLIAWPITKSVGVGETAPYDVYQWYHANSNEEGSWTKQDYKCGADLSIYTINSAGIVAAVNADGQSSIKLNADKINFQAQTVTVKNNDGDTTFALTRQGDVSIRGTINATGGSIGGWTMDGVSLTSGDVGIRTDSKYYGVSLKTTDKTYSPIRFYAGTKKENLYEGTTGSAPDINTGIPFIILEDGSLYAKNAKLSGNAVVEGKLIAKEGSEIGACKIDEWGAISAPGFEISGGGYLKASGAELSGNITATSGSIGSWGILDSGVLLTVQDVTQTINGYNYEFRYGIRLDADVSTFIAGRNGVAFAIGSPNEKFNDGTEYWDSANFQVRADGTLIANDVQINGNIDVQNGSIGGIEVVQGALRGRNNDDEIAYTIQYDGISLLNDSASIRFGNVGYLQYDNESNSARIHIEQSEFVMSQNCVVDGKVVESSIQVGYNGGGGDANIGVGNARLYLVECYGQFEQIGTEKNCSAKFMVEINKQTNIDTHFMIDCHYTDVFGSTSTRQVTVTVKAGETQAETGYIYHIHTAGFKFKFTNSQTWSGGGMPSQLPTSSTEYVSETYYNTSDAYPGVYITGDLLPSEDEAYDLGSPYTGVLNSRKFWKTIYCNTSAIDLSDRKEKNSISPLNDAYSAIFDDLKPVSYKFNNNQSNRTHVGFIAQDVKDAIINAGLTTQDYACYCEWGQDDNIGCGLRYEEFIALCVHEIQKLKKRVAELETQQNDCVEDNIEDCNEID